MIWNVSAFCIQVSWRASPHAGAVLWSWKENYVNASIPKDQLNNVFFIIFISLKISPRKLFQNILYSPNRFFVLFALKQLCTLLSRFSSFLPWHNLPRAARKLLQCMFPFLMDCCRRKKNARSAETFSMYNSLSYGLRKKKAARSAETFSKLTSFFSGLRRNRPESVCR